MAERLEARTLSLQDDQHAIHAPLPGKANLLAGCLVERVAVAGEEARQMPSSQTPHMSIPVAFSSLPP